jgi:hypothetical protein
MRHLFATAIVHLNCGRHLSPKFAAAICGRNLQQHFAAALSGRNLCPYLRTLFEAANFSLILTDEN